MEENDFNAKMKMRELCRACLWILVTGAAFRFYNADDNDDHHHTIT